MHGVTSRACAGTRMRTPISLFLREKAFVTDEGCVTFWKAVSLRLDF